MNVTKKNISIRRIYLNMITEMDRYKKQFDECDVFLIERQMSFRQEKNKYDGIKIRATLLFVSLNEIFK